MEGEVLLAALLAASRGAPPGQVLTWAYRPGWIFLTTGM
jgi:hypothetical protein